MSDDALALACELLSVVVVAANVGQNECDNVLATPRRKTCPAYFAKLQQKKFPQK